MKNFIIILIILVVCQMQAQSNCNLIPNGDFEQGDIDFTSDYNSVSNGATFPQSSYWVVSHDNVQCVEIKDHAFCESNVANTNIMLVNGEYGQDASIDNVIWQTNQPITVIQDRTYTFGFSFKKFADLFYSCGSDWVNLKVERSFDQGATWGSVANLYLTSNSAECDWEEEQRNVYTTGTALSIRIVLEETGGRSGNAFALDDIYLKEYQNPDLQMSLTSSLPPNATTPLDVTASMGIILPFDDNDYLPSACGYTWYVINLDDGTYTSGGTISPIFPWGTTTNFDGVDLFPNINYRIVLLVSCPSCFSSEWIFQDFRIDVSSFSVAKIGEKKIVEFTSTKVLRGTELKRVKELLANFNAIQKSGEEDTIIVPSSEEEREKSKNDEDIVIVWPNPIMEQFNIKFDKKPLVVSIVDMKGSTIYNNRNVKNLQLENIDISQVPNGIYIVKIEFEDGIVAKKIVKNNNSYKAK